jgi:hypothetical protein
MIDFLAEINHLPHPFTPHHISLTQVRVWDRAFCYAVLLRISAIQGGDFL